MAKICLWITVRRTTECGKHMPTKAPTRTCPRCHGNGWLKGMGAMPHPQPCTNCSAWKTVGSASAMQRQNGKMNMDHDTQREAVARAICTACDENPNHLGDAGGNAHRWQDYLKAAEAAIAAMGLA